MFNNAYIYIYYLKFGSNISFVSQLELFCFTWIIINYKHCPCKTIIIIYYFLINYEKL